MADGLWRPVVRPDDHQYLDTTGPVRLDAHSPDELVETAVAWSDRLGELALLRRELRDRFNASTLGDPQRYTRGLEAAYRDIWYQWCKKVE